MMAAYKARVEQGQLSFADLHVRHLSGAMLDAAREVDIHEKVWRPAFLKRQSNKGVRRTEALRKLAKQRTQLEKAALAASACKAGWEKGVEYFRAVVKECRSAVAATSAGLDVSVDLAGVILCTVLAFTQQYCSGPVVLLCIRQYSMAVAVVNVILLYMCVLLYTAVLPLLQTRLSNLKHAPET